MRWIPFVILVYVACVLQTTAMAFLEVHSVRPDLLVLVAVYYALLARRPDALLACWLLGLAVDLNGLSFHTRSNVGLHALAFGLIALLAVRVRELFFRDQMMTFVWFMVAWVLLLEALVGMHLMWATGQWNRFGELALAGTYTAIYTAIFAPYVHWLLKRLRPTLGLEVVRTYRGRGRE